MVGEKQNQLWLPVFPPDERVKQSRPEYFASDIVGNRDALCRIGRIIYDMTAYENRCCDETTQSKHPARSIAFIGAPGTGKTTFARLIAKSTHLPFLEVQGQSLTEVNILLTQISAVLDETNVLFNEGGQTLELMEVGGDGCGSRCFVIPPMVIFIDEVHTLRDKVVQGLLKATEPKDRLLVTEKGWVADCRHIFWVIATTQRGLLDKAYDSRFVQITLNPYTRAEIAKIVHINFPKWDESLCELVTKYGGNIPRSVLLFAEDVQRAIVMEGQENLSALVEEIARQHQIDQFGMSYQTLNILKVLKGGSVSKGRMMYIAGVQLAELENFIMPPLLNISPDGDPPLVAVESRGYVLTEAGEDELQKRKWHDE